MPRGDWRAYRLAARAGLIILTLSIAGFALGKPAVHEKSAAPDKVAQQYQRGTRESPLVVETRPAPKTSDEAASDKREAQEKLRNDRNMVLWTRILAFVAVLQLAVFGYQAFMLRKSVLDTKDAIDAAKRSATAAEKTVEKSAAILEHAVNSTQRELRAYLLPAGKIICDPIRAMAHFHAEVKIKNTGRTPASNVCIWGGAMVLPVNSDTQTFRTRPSEGVLKCRFVLGAGDEHIAVCQTERVLTPEETLAIDQGTHAVFMAGGAIYLDVFGAERETHFRMKCRQNIIPCTEGNSYT